MAENFITCPVCGEKMMSYASSCPNCAFEIHILPDAAPSQLVELENMRIENAKRGLNIMQQRLDQKDSELAQKDNEIAQLQQEAEPAQRQIGQLRNQNQRLQSDLNAQQENLAVANQQIKRLNTQIQSMPKSAPAPQATASQSNGRQPFAFLVVFNGQEAQLVLGVYSGDNSFGTAPSEPFHYQLLLPDDALTAHHFTIKASVRTDNHNRRRANYTITPVDGQVYRAANNGNIVNGEDSLAINDSFYIGELKFTLLDNKNNKNKE